MSTEGYDTYAQQPLGDNLLAQISATARQIIEARAEVDKAQEELTEAQRYLRTLEEEVLVELMEEAGQSDIKTSDGLKIKIQEVYRGQPTKANEAEAFAWLRKEGHGAILKNKITAELGRKEDDKAGEVMDSLREQGLQPSRKVSVHWQTLCSLVREMMEDGDNVPLDLLGVSRTKKAAVKEK